MYIKQSVGLNAKNNKNDVFFIQDLINLIAFDDMRIPELIVDGKIGDKTNTAIYKFQQYIVKLKVPDSRIDPNGRSEKTLVAKAIEIDLEAIPVLAKKYNLKKEKLAITGSGPRNIIYQPKARKVVSTYSENIIKLAMGYSGINKCDFSSTLRTYNDQARIMYDNCAAFPNANSVTALRAARNWGYGSSGRAVEKLYYEHKSEAKDDVKKIMEDKIIELYKQGKMVSLHCVAEADYKKKNVLDISYKSVLTGKRKDFEQSLMAMSLEVKNPRYTQPSAGVSYITRLIIENACWHIEITQDNKALPNQKKPAAPKRKKQAGTCSVKVTRNYLFDFLDEWY